MTKGDQGGLLRSRALFHPRLPRQPLPQFSMSATDEPVKIPGLFVYANGKRLLNLD
jgi:hypothetical protein